MICNVIDNDYYIIKIYNNYLDFDIYNHDEVGKFIEGIFKNILKWRGSILGTSIVYSLRISSVNGMYLRSSTAVTPFVKRTYKRAQPYFHRTEVGYLVNFNLGVKFAAAFQNFAHLVCCNGVHPAPE